ncbi:MAG: hypothetical protein EXQ49_07835 [Acidobacteria bacterium]|nr:hypothetical protein [Acidobacteriota bacterium]
MQREIGHAVLQKLQCRRNPPSQYFARRSDTETLMNLGAQVDYFLNGVDVNSLYVFGNVGLAT